MPFVHISIPHTTHAAPYILELSLPMNSQEKTNLAQTLEYHHQKSLLETLVVQEWNQHDFIKDGLKRYRLYLLRGPLMQRI